MLLDNLLKIRDRAIVYSTIFKTRRVFGASSDNRVTTGYQLGNWEIPGSRCSHTSLGRTFSRILNCSLVQNGKFVIPVIPRTLPNSWNVSNIFVNEPTQCSGKAPTLTINDPLRVTNDVPISVIPPLLRVQNKCIPFFTRRLTLSLRCSHFVLLVYKSKIHNYSTGKQLIRSIFYWI